VRTILESGSWCWDPYGEGQMNVSDRAQERG